MKYILKPVIKLVYFLFILIANYGALSIIFLATLIWTFSIKKAIEITRKETEHDFFHEGEEPNEEGKMVKFSYKHPWDLITGKKIYK